MILLLLQKSLLFNIYLEIHGMYVVVFAIQLNQCPKLLHFMFVQLPFFCIVFLILQCNNAVLFSMWLFQCFVQNDDKPYVASQCFLTDNALYVLCWQITSDKDHGISKLRNWLLRIHVCDCCVFIRVSKLNDVSSKFYHFLMLQLLF